MTPKEAYKLGHEKVMGPDPTIRSREWHAASFKIGMEIFCWLKVNYAIILIDPEVTLRIDMPDEIVAAFSERFL